VAGQDHAGLSLLDTPAPLRQLHQTDFIVTKRWCISLQRHDQSLLLHGQESGIIMRSTEGGYSERHRPLSPSRAYMLTARDLDPHVLFAAETDRDRNGQGAPSRRAILLSGVRRRILKVMYADNVQKPTAAQLQERVGDHGGP